MAAEDDGLSTAEDDAALAEAKDLGERSTKSGSNSEQFVMDDSIVPELMMMVPLEASSSSLQQ